jgi:hypothetical protein
MNWKVVGGSYCYAVLRVFLVTEENNKKPSVTVADFLTERMYSFVRYFEKLHCA